MAAKKPAKSKGGRPLKFDDKMRGIVCGAIQMGMPIRLACDLVGISYECAKATQRRDPAFRAQVSNAKAGRVLTWLKCFQVAMDKKGDWRAAQYLMKVTHPEYFAERDPEAVNRGELTNILNSIAARIRDGLPRKMHGVIDAAFSGKTDDAPPKKAT